MCLQEMCKDSTQQFRCVGLLTKQEARRDLGVEGTLIQLDIGFRKGSMGGKSSLAYCPEDNT